MKTEIDFGASVVALINLSNKLQKQSAGCEDLDEMYRIVLEIRDVSGTLKEMMRREYDQ